ncbi:uncharacterized protein G2W53_006708 [Senna tora]|uniref:Uncharacterized protein n=1 Tax=Senna tora TaxID=362788 RepID=A0A835CCS5_9FABA|nr:uncharacterized protein G2W53_006708 [Senna tora]
MELPYNMTEFPEAEAKNDGSACQLVTMKCEIMY